MKLTESHIRFWIQHRGPSFVQKFYQEKLEESKKKYFAADPRVDINCLIPHKKTTENEVAISNLLYLCRSYRKRGELTQNLARISVNPGTTYNPKKRAALAKKWLGKIKNNS